jgi:hypothetical protein
MTQSKESFQYSERKTQISMPSAIEMSIRKVDWCRIYRGVKSIPKSTSAYQIVSTFFYGIGTSGLISLIPLYSSKTDLWVKHLTLLAVIVAIIIGYILQKLSKMHEHYIEINTESVKKDMQDIHNTFYPNEDL